jgi:hypothetical protein
VRGVPGNWHSYRDKLFTAVALPANPGNPGILKILAQTLFFVFNPGISGK